MSKILLLISFLSGSLYSFNENSSYNKIQFFLKKKDYISAARTAEVYIKSLEEINQSDKIVKIYFLVESNLDKLDIILDTIYKNSNRLNFKFHSLVYILIEKALLAGDYQLGAKWGEIYKKEARSKKKKYYRGLYLFACHLYKKNDRVNALAVIESVLREKTKKNLKDKLTLLKILHYKNEYQFTNESKIFLKNNSESNYVDFVFANMIHNAKSFNKKEKVKEWKEDFFAEQRDSILIDKIKSL